jgi:cyclic pyranopterin phosphate synthase
MSHSFCERCDKIRVTADGRLKPCLHTDDEILLQGLHGDELMQAIKNGILNKPMCHNLESVGSQSSRNMNEIGG